MNALVDQAGRLSARSWSLLNMDGVVNTHTQTVHRHEHGRASLETACGLTAHVDADRLQRTSLDRAADDADASRCGRCFEDAGGY